MRSIKLPSWIERLLALNPVLPPPHVFALDRHELRYGAFHSSPQGFTFETCRREPLPEGLVQPGLLGAPFREPRRFWEFLQDFVASLHGPIDRASLILPDSWLRLTFIESSELPRGAKARMEILRFKLKRLVPFRVEDLRISDIAVTPFAQQDEPLRLLLGFAIESLLKQIEDAFKGVGIEIGQVTNNTLALLSGLEHLLGQDELAALVLVERDDFTLSYLLGGEILLYRYKAFADETASDVSWAGSAPPVDPGSVRRDLRLTSNFVRQQFPEKSLGRLFLAAPQEREAEWLDWLSDELGVMAEPLGFEHFPLTRTQADQGWQVTGPLLGAASIKVT